MSHYRAIYLGNDKWLVRRFDDPGAYEARLTLRVDDPQLRSADKAAIDKAIADNKWERI